MDLNEIQCGSGDGQMAGCCEHGNEPLCLVKWRKSVGCLGKY